MMLAALYTLICLLTIALVLLVRQRAAFVKKRDEVRKLVAHMTAVRTYVMPDRVAKPEDLTSAPRRVMRVEYDGESGSWCMHDSFPKGRA